MMNDEPQLIRVSNVPLLPTHFLIGNARPTRCSPYNLSSKIDTQRRYLLVKTVRKITSFHSQKRVPNDD
jgi:hypothetical protein